MRIEYTFTIPDFFIASWKKDFVTIFWHWRFWKHSFEFILREFLLPKVIYNTDRYGDKLRPCFWSSGKYLESWSRKGFVEACDSVEILLTKSIFNWGISASKQLSYLSIKMVLVWDADTITCNFIIRVINISIAMLGISPGNAMVFLYNIRGISPGVSTNLSSYSFSWRFFTRRTWYVVSLFEYIWECLN